MIRHKIALVWKHWRPAAHGLLQRTWLPYVFKNESGDGFVTGDASSTVVKQGLMAALGGYALMDDVTAFVDLGANVGLVSQALPRL